jgi:copper chaperone CopZ
MEHGIMKQIYRLSVLFFLLIGIVASGCAGLDSKSAQTGVYKEGISYSDSVEYDSNYAMDDSVDGSSQGAGEISTGRKTITTVDISIEVDDAQLTVEKIVKAAHDAGGYVSSSSVYDSYYGSNNAKEGYVTVRVPESDSPKFIEDLGQLGKVTSKSESGRDVTEEYIDVTARLNNLKRQETRLFDVLNMTTTVEEILSVEKELERVRGEIDSLTGRLNYLDDKIDFSTINVRVSEPRPITHSWGLRDAVSESVNGFISMVNALIVLVGYILPLVIVLVVFGGSAIAIRRRMRR